MTYLQIFKEVPPDPILGLTAQFKKDPNPNKINLTIGVYKTEEGQISLLKSVHQAEKWLLNEQQNKGYPPIDGEVGFNEQMLRLIVPKDIHNSIYVAHTVGATSALRLSGELLKKMGIQNIYYSDLTWPNHPHVFRESGLNVHTFPYYDTLKHELKISEICSALEQIPEKSAVLFQLCCHNPTGRDPQSHEWAQIIEIIKNRKLFPVIDCAYHGFGQGLDEDLAPFKMFLEQVDELFLCYSCAKNFGLYGERVGALIAYDRSCKNLEHLAQNARSIIRRNYSTPPIHGARIVKTILESEELTELWHEELKEMRLRVKNLRQQFLKSFKDQHIREDYRFVIEDQGLFSLLHLPKEMTLKLRHDFGIYLLDNGRINIAALSQQNIDIVTSSIQKVLALR